MVDRSCMMENDQCHMRDRDSTMWWTEVVCWVGMVMKMAV